MVKGRFPVENHLSLPTLTCGFNQQILERDSGPDWEGPFYSRILPKLQVLMSGFSVDLTWAIPLTYSNSICDPLQCSELSRVTM